MYDRKELFKKLTEAFGPSGYEGEVREIITENLSKYTQVRYDRLGSVIGEKRGNEDSPKIMFAAHMDEVGFMVESITKDGFIKFLPLGGWWEGVLIGQRVRIRGRGRDIIGVIGSKPPHLLKEEEKKKIPELKDLYIDVGATKDFDVKENLGIRPGDPIIPISSFTPLENSIYLAKAWDDRVGCCLLIELAKELSKGFHPNTLYFVGTVQEEVGLRGAKTASSVIDPDIGIAIDVSISKDIPGEEESEEKLKSGVAILIHDRTMIPNIRLRDFIVELAERDKIPYHFASVRGGYDTGRIHLHRMGVPSLALGIPTRYIHSHQGMIAEEDYDAVLNLLKSIALNLNRDILRSITDFKLKEGYEGYNT